MLSSCAWCPRSFIDEASSSSSSLSSFACYKIVHVPQAVDWLSVEAAGAAWAANFS